MKKQPNERWVRLHTIATTCGQKMNLYSMDETGLLALIDGKEAGIVGYTRDFSFDGLELDTEHKREEVGGTPLYDSDGDPAWYNWYNWDTDFTPEDTIVREWDQINWTWVGTAEELFYAARNDTDLMFPDRKLSETDFDYRELTDLYAQIRKYLTKQSRKQKKRKAAHQTTGADTVFKDVPLKNSELYE